jgi:hypothetical protein
MALSGALGEPVLPSTAFRRYKEPAVREAVPEPETVVPAAVPVVTTIVHDPTAAPTVLVEAVTELIVNVNEVAGWAEPPVISFPFCAVQL